MVANESSSNTILLASLATSVPAPAYDGAVVQLILGERTSTVQLFRAGYLGYVREFPESIVLFDEIE